MPVHRKLSNKKFVFLALNIKAIYIDSVADSRHAVKNSFYVNAVFAHVSFYNVI